MERSAHTTACGCGRVAQREFAVPGISGFVRTPTAQVPVHLDRFIEAQSEMIETARRTGTQAPDMWGVAQERIRRGDVQAIT